MDLPILEHLLTRIACREGSLRDVAVQAGVPYDTLCKIVQRKQIPRLDTAERLLKLFPIEPTACQSPQCIEAAGQEAA